VRLSDLFISYASADRDKARQIASVLEARGHSVWWDRTIPPGRVFDEVIQEALSAAKCAIVLWSKASVKSNWVKTEAAEAEARNMLVPAMIEPTPLPLEFKRIQTADLSHWDGEPGHPELLNLVASVEQLVRGETPPPRAIGTVSPRRPIPRFVLPAIALVLVVAGGWFAYEYMTSENAEREPARVESKPPQNTGREPARVESKPSAFEQPEKRDVAALISQTDFGKGRKRTNVLAQENGGQILVAAGDAWAKMIDGEETMSAYIDNGEAVFAFKDERPAVFDMFTVFIRETNEFNLNEFELLSGNESPLGRFDSIGKFKTQNGKLFKTPYQEFAFPAVRARYLKVRSLSNHRGERGVVYAYEFQLLGNIE
jgi:hypothetical protein